jgi:guanylate kinase
MAEKGILIVVSGPSGVGKDTVVSRFLQSAPDNFALSVSATTRAPRPGETEGREYYFVSRDEFERMTAAGDMLEYAEYNGNYYGTPRAMVDLSREAGRHVILIIEVQGAMKIRAAYPEALFIFIMPPSAEVLRERLRGRGTEDESAILRRIRAAEREMSFSERYDHVIVNSDIDVCAAELAEIIRACKR